LIDTLKALNDSLTGTAPAGSLLWDKLRRSTTSGPRTSDLENDPAGSCRSTADLVDWSAMTTYEELFENNRRWVGESLARDPEHFVRLAEGQTPKFLFIGCSDSRVPADQITGTSAGEMLVHRNIANLVIYTDMNLMSVLQFAVEELKVEHIIVCGHYSCGGVRAAMDGHHHGLIDKWLRNIKDVYRLHRSELDAIADADQRSRRLVELNVEEQVFKVCSTSIVQRAWQHEERALHVHGWVYEIAEGLIRDLQVDPAGTTFEGAAGLYDYDDLG